VNLEVLYVNQPPSPNVVSAPVIDDIRGIAFHDDDDHRHQASPPESIEWTHSIIDRIARESRGLVRQSTTFTKRRQRSCY